MKLIQGDRIHTEQVGDTYKLTINKVGVRDYGQYYCRANNLLDKEVTAEIVLTGVTKFETCCESQIMNELFTFTGSPSIPSITGDMTSGQMYSYDVVWTVHSEYQLIQHEVVYWPVAAGALDIKNTPPSTSHTRRVPASMASR